jgi:hypothetical protein
MALTFNQQLGAMGIDKGVSGLAGAGAGYLRGKANMRGLKSGIKSEKEMMDQILGIGAERLGEYQDAYGGAIGDMPQSTEDYFASLDAYDPSKYDVQAPQEEFSYDMNAKTKEFLNPEIDAILGKANQAIEGSAANRGSLFSGATGRAIAGSTADITAKEYGRAQNVAQQDKASSYQQYADKFSRELQALQNNAQNAQRGMQSKQAGFDTRSQLFGGQQDIRNATDEARLASQGRLNELRASKAGTNTGFGAIAEGFLSALGG